jgi:fermentation-respiration switch protein FrsA (DUF1100 family)
MSDAASAALTRPLLHALLFFPSRLIATTPAAAGLEFEDIWFESGDGERLHAWWVPARAPVIGHLLLCHGNAGNVGDRVAPAGLLAAGGFDVLLFDYRGYGRSTGRPSEQGTYRDAHAARSVLLRQPGVDGARVLYLGESLGAAVALALARDLRPAGLILQSPFTGIRDMARLHYPLIPRMFVPDAYPSLRLIGELPVPLLVLHGDRDEIVPLRQGRALYDAAPGPKRMEVFAGVGHDDFVARARRRWLAAIADWARGLRPVSER